MIFNPNDFEVAAPHSKAMVLLSIYPIGK